MRKATHALSLIALLVLVGGSSLTAMADSIPFSGDVNGGFSETRVGRLVDVGVGLSAFNRPESLPEVVILKRPERSNRGDKKPIGNEAVVTTPEPGSLWLMATGAVGLLGLKRKKLP